MGLSAQQNHELEQMGQLEAPRGRGESFTARSAFVPARGFAAPKGQSTAGALAVAQSLSGDRRITELGSRLVEPAVEWANFSVGGRRQGP